MNGRREARSYNTSNRQNNNALSRKRTRRGGNGRFERSRDGQSSGFSSSFAGKPRAGAFSRGKQHTKPQVRKPRAGAQVHYIEGRRACNEALSLAMPLMRALIQKDVQSPDIRAFEQACIARDIPCEYVPKAALDAASSHGAHQGVMLVTKPFAYAEFADVLRTIDERAAATPALPQLVVVLDHVVDEGNLGACVRSAEIVGATAVIIANARAAQVGVGAYKTSAGAVLRVPIVQVANVARAVLELKNHGFWAMAATEHAQQAVWSSPCTGNVCLVMGSEQQGISALVRKSCDFECKLPQRGVIESLNVAQAATVMCYEWLRVNETALMAGDGGTAGDAAAAENASAAYNAPANADEFFQS